MATARQLPADVYPETLSRLPPLKRETLNKAQQKAYDALAAPRSGRLNLAGIKGPGGVILRMPKLAKSLGDVNRVLREQVRIDGRGPRDIRPLTAQIGVLGLLEDVERIVRPPFQGEGDLVVVLGEAGPGMAGSAYERLAGAAPDDRL